MTNQFLDRTMRPRPPKAYLRSPKQEKALAKRFGGQQVSASGRGHKKGDIHVAGISRIEAKTTSKNSFSVTIDMVEKIRAAAQMSDEIPAIVVEFLNELGQPYAEVMVIETRILVEVIHALKSLTQTR